jgi:signal transduction histidine kinase
MSERSRASLGDALNLIDTIKAEARSRASARTPAAVSLRFSRVLRTGDRVWISAQAAEPAESVGHEEVAGLLHLQSSLLRHCFRLQLAERDLSTLARQRRRESGRAAVRQIELERQRLGRELHTSLGQMLAAIRLQLEIIASHFPDPPALVQQALSHISALANEALEQVRSISKRLHPPEWQRLTLEAALQQLWNISGIPQRFEASLRIQPLPHEPDLEAKVLVYRAVQEALSNVVRHARATRIDVALEAHDDRVVLRIQDNGVGFDVAGLLRGPAGMASGIGLRSIREQAAALGGKLEIESGPAGTTLVVSVPFS